MKEPKGITGRDPEKATQPETEQLAAIRRKTKATGQQSKKIIAGDYHKCHLICLFVNFFVYLF